MPKFPVYNPKDIEKLILHGGFKFSRQKGSHRIYFNQVKNKTVIIPFHKKDLPIGTAKSILRMADIY
ncbi:type II toxin-antitoxin system HicA family toxin [Candidatus Gracilibacteria bacterium]|nr:type II toxin-antitoxin system HicA family toxin [Candidatus Gracilibacteria bacterium]